MNLSLTLWAACLAALSIIVKAFPQGGSKLKDHCGDLKPKPKSGGGGHSGVKTSPDAKFAITINATELDAGKAMEVTVKGKSGNDVFKGFLCIVSLATDTQTFKPKGTMSETDEEKFTTTVDCTGAGTATGASHYNKNATESRETHATPATFVWTAPASAQAETKYKLRCTIVQDKKHSYMGYEKDIKVNAGGVAPSSSSAPGPTTQKSSSPRNMASGFMLLATVIVAMEKSG